jgi:hypothetical protein
MAKTAYENELETIINKIIDLVAARDLEIEARVREWKKVDKLSLEKLGSEAELKIQAEELKRIRKGIKAVIDRSTNRLIVSTREPADN